LPQERKKFRNMKNPELSNPNMVTPSTIVVNHNHYTKSTFAFENSSFILIKQFPHIFFQQSK